MVYQFLKTTFDKHDDVATYRHIEALAADWCEEGSPKNKRPELEKNIRTLLLDRLGAELNPTTIYRAVNHIQDLYNGIARNPEYENSKIEKLDPLVLPIQGDNPSANRMGVLEEIITGKNKHRIIRSLAYARDHLLQIPEYHTADRLRYVYWADHILNRLEATGWLDQVPGIHRDLDLWVLTKVFERRHLLYGEEGMKDLFAWLTHPPFMSYEDQNAYLSYVELGNIPALKQGKFVTVTETVVIPNDDYFESWNDLDLVGDYWNDENAYQTPEAKFLVADGLFAFIKTRPMWLQDQLSYQTYLLPSQQLGLFMKWFDVLKDEDKAKFNRDTDKTVLTWGIPPAYKLDLNDFPRTGVRVD